MWRIQRKQNCDMKNDAPLFGKYARFIQTVERLKSPKDRFGVYLVIMIIIAVILVSAAFVGVLYQEKVQVSEDISGQHAKPMTAPSGAGNSLVPTTIWNAGNTASTNTLAPLPAPIISVTSSN